MPLPSQGFGKDSRLAALSPMTEGLASAVSQVFQVDNKSEFLEQVPHRRHPGILHMKMVKLPQEVSNSARLLLQNSSLRQLEEKVQALTNYLWSRKCPMEDSELQTRATQLEERLRSKVGPPTSEFQDPDKKTELEQKLQQKVLTLLRKTTYHWQPLSYNEDQSLVYLASRLAGEYAALSRVFHEIRKRVPDFAPYSLLDFGSGVGSVTWAAHTAWGETIREYVCVDSSASMNLLAELLLKGGSDSQQMCIPGVYFRQFLPVSPKVKFDLVVSAYSLNELPSRSHRISTVETLWRKTNGFLVLIENGTKEGHHLLMEARDTVLRAKDKVCHDPRPAHVFAPCPHQLPCPRFSWMKPLPCNFIQAYEPLPFSWNKSVKLERFSFLIMSRGSPPDEARWPRIVQEVQRRTRHVHCRLCCSDGSLQHIVITRKYGRDLYRCARTSEWGDRLPVIQSSMEGDPEADGTALEEDTEPPAVEKT
ncbi:methyltransferase-like protein 17, mitochondrial isoform X2 [Rhinatrema bivittatum]|uniref:methyltransferase-like protein 17, mitochondrial isoform X2 n=1 Tax=Rhinatrema bivittatum TaxID=194408 RepID=UPI00112B4250|nr:methyltransferase-like protein 17, mitochondrial isoform X2 [Rhinatrema bivittatum]